MDLRWVSLGLLAAGPLLAADAAVLLRIRPGPAAVEFKVKGETVQLVGGAKGRPRRTEVRSSETLARRVEAGPDGKLKVHLARKGKRIEIDGANRVGFPDQAVETSIDDRGRPQDAAGQGSSEGLAYPFFPDRAVGPGSRWEAAVPATADFPIPLQVEHRVVALEEVAGIPCAVIESKGSGRGIDPRSKATVEASLKGKVSVAVADGAPVRSRSRVELRLTYPEAFDDQGHTTLKKSTLRTLARIDPTRKRDR